MPIAAKLKNAPMIKTESGTRALGENHNWYAPANPTSAIPANIAAATTLTASSMLAYLQT
jgi:hypothetical protein